ncbi:MAG: sulfur carrier protein ThiS [Oxalobacter sp.]|nr:MAG: sulfur carrier protein ThiS [Oxalobacter sp.]
MSVDFTLNGEPSTMPQGTHLNGLLKELELNNTPVTIKVNGKRLMRKDWQQAIQAGDRIEIGLSIPHSCITVPM